jgi:hypothetical protein
VSGNAAGRRYFTIEQGDGAIDKADIFELLAK